MADFDNSNPNFYFQGFGLNGLDVFKAGTIKPAYQTGIGLYAQDKWQVTPRLTVTYGVRWDGTRNPQTQTVITGQQVYVGVGSGSHLVPVPQKVPNDYEQWGPRVGVAWNVGGTSHPTTVRGAWGLYYAQTPTIFFPTGGSANAQTLFCPPQFGCAPPSSVPAQQPVGVPYIDQSSFSFGVGQMCAQSVIGCPSINYVDPAFRNPRVSNLTVGVEHQFARDWTVSVNYAYMYSWRLKTGVVQHFHLAKKLSSPPEPTSLGAPSWRVGCRRGAGHLALPQVSLFSAPCQQTVRSLFLAWANSRASATVPTTLSQQVSTSASHNAISGLLTIHGRVTTATTPASGIPIRSSVPRILSTSTSTMAAMAFDISHQFKSGRIVADLPHGLNWSSNFIYHSGLAYPAYSSADLNGDGGGQPVLQQWSARRSAW